MATTNQIKFYKSSVQPSAPSLGSIWFNTVNRTVNVFVGGETQWEKYAGLVDASWNNDGTVLTITNATGATATLNIAQFATVAALNQAISDLNASIKTAKDAADAAQGTANDAAAAAAEADRKAVQEKTDREGEITRVEGLISAEATTARAAEQANAKAAKDADDKASAAQTYAEGVNTALGQEVTRATAEEARIAGLVSTEETRAKGVEDELRGLIGTAASGATTEVAKAAAAAHITVTPSTGANGQKIYTIGESDIASAQALADEIADRAVDEQAIINRVALLDTAETGRVSVLEKQVAALSSATHFIGVKDNLPASGADGDIVIVGNKEYIYDSTQDPKWIELGDTTAESGRISTLESLVGTTSVGAQIDAKIAALSDEAKSSEDANLVKVTVSQANGNVTAVSVNDEALDAKFKLTDDAVALNTAAVADYKTRIESLEATKNALDSTYVKVSTYNTDKEAFVQKHADLQGAIDAAEGRLDVVEGEVDGVQEDVANLQAGTGLADGASAPVYTKSNYLGSATTMVAADMALDAKIKEVADSVTSKNVSAEGDAYISATAANNKVTIAAVTGKVESKSGLATNQGVYDALCWVEFA